MKTYQNEQEFVANFAKDCKESLRNGQNFEAVWNNVNIVISGMDNNNASKVTMYSGTLDGVAFSGSITALKKRLNITFTKEYNRSIEASTKVVIKSDEELSRTADTATKRINEAINVLKQASQRYGLSRADMERDGLRETILACLCKQRDNEALRRENEAKKKAEETAKKIEAEKAKLEKQLKELQAKLAKMK